ALEKERERRQQSVGELRTQVETIAGEMGSVRASRAVFDAPVGNNPNQPGEAANQLGAVRAGDDSSARARTTARQARALPEPRFSRQAIWAALWALVLPVGLVLNH